MATQLSSRSYSSNQDEGVEEKEDSFDSLPIVQGYLSKWTNYIHGWQDRYIVCKDGTLSYYKTPEETTLGCRGAISLTKASMLPHKLDECRFDIMWAEQIWYLRASSSAQREYWLEALKVHLLADINLPSNNSSLSIDSSDESSECWNCEQELREKMNELENYRDILCKQVDTLQKYFDLCANNACVEEKLPLSFDKNQWHLRGGSEDLESHRFNANVVESDDFMEAVTMEPTGCLPNATIFKSGFFSAKPKPTYQQQQAIQHFMDFKGEAAAFKSTTAGIILQLSNMLEYLSLQEEKNRLRLEKEINRRKRVEEENRILQLKKAKSIVLGGPDFEEGPDFNLGDDEFFDAIELQLDKMELNHSQRETLRTASFSESALQREHPLFDEITRVCALHLQNARIKEDHPGEEWELLGDNDGMQIYHREIEDNGVIVEPLLALHCASGFTAKEFCSTFWDLNCRLDWEENLDEPPHLLESVSADTVVVHQVYKRVWPTAQRDAVFWSRIVHQNDLSMVVNYSTDYAASPNKPNTVRLKVNVAMVCETLWPKNVTLNEIGREDLRCKIRYSAYVNPGGWAPARVVRSITRREGPKFLKKFTQFVKDRTENKSIVT